MPKINQEEYEVLKGLDSRWKWIARDKNLELWAYSEKSGKFDTKWDVDHIHELTRLSNGLFQFIQWEDEEPYNIAELIEEYESEEREMKKNIECLKQWIEEYESEVIEERKDELNGFITTLSHGKQSAIKKIKQKIDQLDKPETLSQGYNQQAYRDGFREGERQTAEYFESITEEPSKEQVWKYLSEHGIEVVEKPTIPEFVADWIEHNQEDDLSDTIHFIIYGLYADWPDTNSMVELRKPVLKWLGEDRNNYFKLIDATKYGYSIEQEPKFHAKVKGWGINGDGGKSFYNGSFPQTLSRRAESLPHTLEKWRDLGIYEDNADFVKVEELEE